MLIQQKLGNLNTYNINNKHIDWLYLHWYETNKRIQRKRTATGREIALQFLQENPALTQGDILFEDEDNIIAITILPCNSIVITPQNMFEMASICYEIGNKHLPLFYADDELLIPFEVPIFRLLTAQGFLVKQEDRQLLQPLTTTVTPHGSESLFSKIMKLTTTSSATTS